MTISMKTVIALALLVFPVGAGIHAVRDQRVTAVRAAEDRRTQQAKLDQEARRQREVTEAEQRKAAARAERLRPILAEARNLLPQCRQMPLGNISVNGKVVIWDETTNSLSTVQNQLSPQLLGSADDSPLTVLMIVDKRNEPVASYGNNPNPFRDPRLPQPNGGLRFPIGSTIGYQSNVEICAIHWPAKTAAGRAVVYGDMPPLSITRAKWDTTPVYGDMNGPLANWVKGLR